jgi:hypothetical protein
VRISNYNPIGRGKLLPSVFTSGLEPERSVHKTAFGKPKMLGVARSDDIFPDWMDG